MYGMKRAKQSGVALGQRIAEIRKMRGLTQVELAAMVGVRQPSLSAFEKRGADRTIRILQRYADALGVSLNTLLGESAVTTSRSRPGPASPLEQLFSEIAALPTVKRRYVESVCRGALAQARQSQIPRTAG